MMIELQSGFKSPIGRNTVCGMETCAEVYKPSGADKLVVYGIVGVVFLIAISNSEGKRIVSLPYFCAEERS